MKTGWVWFREGSRMEDGDKLKSAVMSFRATPTGWRSVPAARACQPTWQLPEIHGQYFSMSTVCHKSWNRKTDAGTTAIPQPPTEIWTATCVSRFPSLPHRAHVDKSSVTGWHLNWLSLHAEAFMCRSAVTESAMGSLCEFGSIMTDIVCSEI